VANDDSRPTTTKRRIDVSISILQNEYEAG
jgi:hypothetical protein